jgi:TolA-binding protein
MAFDSRDQSFNLSTQEGQVIVSGGCQQLSQKVSAGESIEWTCPPRKVEPSTLGHEGETLPEASPGEQPRAEPQDLTRAAPPTTPGTQAWRGLLAAGRLSDGLASAKRTGFPRACRMATSKELLTLADAARLFGSAADAVAPLRVLRQRFAGTPDAATAAFRLGLIAFERERDYHEASQWFEIYLRDQPSGPLMGDSFGRLMQARWRAGDKPRARSDAQQYLRRFPEGPYASEARGILSQ